jgi:hypothetical protein
MPIDPRHVGRRYGPFRTTVCAEQIRAFAIAVAGGTPGYFGGGVGTPGASTTRRPACRPTGRWWRRPPSASPSP